MFRVVFLAFFGAPAAGPGGAHVHEAPHAHEPPPTMLLPLWVLAILTMTVGIYFTIYRGDAAEGGAPPWLTPSAVGVATAGILLAWLTYQQRTIDAVRLAAMFGPIRRAAIAKFWIDDLFEALYGVVLLGFSRIVGWIDRYLVDGVLNMLSAWTLTAGDDLRQIQTGKAQDYVYGVAVGVLVLILLMQL